MRADQRDNGMIRYCCCRVVCSRIMRKRMLSVCGTRARECDACAGQRMALRCLAGGAER